MRDNEALAQPIITPTSKAFDGGHDEPLSPDEIVDQGLLTKDQWEQVSGYALALFARGQAMARERGLILADTKYEFGTDPEGRIMLADEIHTPDSSRYWFAETYPRRFANGERPESFDKDFVRSWIAERCDPYSEPIPDIPAELIAQTSQVYVRAFETITGRDIRATGRRRPAANGYGRTWLATSDGQLSLTGNVFVSSLTKKSP